MAQKVYAVLPARASGSFTPLEIAKALKESTGASPDIHTMRGCLGRLKDAGLVKEIVPGSFRRVEVKEKESMSEQRMTTVKLRPGPIATGMSLESVAPAGAEPVVKGEPMDVIGGIAAKLRSEAKALLRIADELDAGAIVMAERAQKLTEEVATVRQIATLLKGLG
ncbi:hypothetical protein [Achromobacter pulmonis]|uniref:hypothetical protein n=1 Tax=Achromobacter pulmonis TaxID=1389932 RepID=UPI0011B292C1|nr:hypothetical protein [Achromobacter pulmonis]